MIVTSLINIFQGTVALFDDERVVATPEAFVLVDMTSWGWALVLFGAVMLGVGGGLLTARTWARIVAIIVVGLHAVAQVASLGAYPAWSLLMIALDTVVLFALTARWSSAAEELRYQNDRPRSATEPAGDPLHGQLAHERTPLYGPRVS